MANYWRRPLISRLVSSNLTTNFEPLLPHNQNCVLGKVLQYSSVPCFGPRLMLPPVDIHGHKFDYFHSLSDYGYEGFNRNSIFGVPDNTRCIASTRGWLGFINTSHDGNCLLYLSKPHSPDQAIQLPPIETLPYVLAVKRHRKWNQTMGVSEFILCDGHDKAKRLSPEVMGKLFTSHLALSSDDPSDKDCILMARQGQTKQLAFCRPGNYEDAWTALDGSQHSYGQIVYSEKDQLFYNILLGNDHSIEAWDVRDPKSPKRTTQFVYKPLSFPSKYLKRSEMMLRNQCLAKHYLVINESSSGDLLLVVRYYADHVAEDGTIVNYEDPTNTLPYKTQRFDVYKVDFARKKVKYVKCLDDNVAIFLGLNHSFAVSTHEFPTLKGNSIYFTDDNTEVIHSEKYPYGGHDLGIFHLEDNSITPCYRLDVSKKIETPLFWVAPSLR